LVIRQGLGALGSVWGGFLWGGDVDRVQLHRIAQIHSKLLLFGYRPRLHTVSQYRSWHHGQFRRRCRPISHLKTNELVPGLPLLPQHLHLFRVLLVLYEPHLIENFRGDFAVALKRGSYCHGCLRGSGF
jgi:hypothetical protein